MSQKKLPVVDDLLMYSRLLSVNTSLVELQTIFKEFSSIIGDDIEVQVADLKGEIFHLMRVYLERLSSIKQ